MYTHIWNCIGYPKVLQISQYTVVYLAVFWYISEKIRYGESQVDISIYLNISVCTICHGTETYRMMRVTVAAGGQASSVPRIQAQSDSGFDPQSRPARGRRLGAWALHGPSPNAGWAWVTSNLRRVTVTDDDPSNWLWPSMSLWLRLRKCYTAFFSANYITPWAHLNEVLKLCCIAWYIACYIVYMLYSMLYMLHSMLCYTAYF